MAVTVDVHRIQPGQADEWRAVVAELSGPRRVDFAEANRRRGVSRVTMAMATAGSDPIALIVWECADADAARRSFRESGDPFDAWLRSRVDALLERREPAEVLFHSSPPRGPWRGLRRAGR